MNIFEAVRNRREITSFEEKKISFDILEKLLDVAYLSPAGNNLPSREFLLITGRDALDHLSKTTPYVSWLTGAQAAIVVTGLPEVSKYWIQDASIACGYIWLAAVELGLGAAFGAVHHTQDAEESERRETFVRSALSIPDDRRILAILGFGYSKQNPVPKQMYPRETVVFYDKFGKTNP
ncbi:nitroreductase family protein [Effusibacillus dendaii]|uniref:Nitroreductase family protein n=1 Tax=Effusibacillus dendaii TaxID=2743772 RepID=A0A7I8DFW1_9BACL|nr:nitroreductase family protein [Effusibacillus dendaii]BCJ88202.1 nitroreductase family protein [Effusibacillus dendaii]